jgi:hypothetical protein
LVCRSALCVVVIIVGRSDAAPACVRVWSGDHLEAILRFTFAYDSPAAICIEVASNNWCVGAPPRCQDSKNLLGRYAAIAQCV